MNESWPVTNQKPAALITGATGFVGSHLAKRLVHEGWRVHIVRRADSRLPEAEEFGHVINHIYDGSTESLVNCVAQAKRSKAAPWCDRYLNVQGDTLR